MDEELELSPRLRLELEPEDLDDLLDLLDLLLEELEPELDEDEDEELLELPERLLPERVLPERDELERVVYGERLLELLEREELEREPDVEYGDFELLLELPLRVELEVPLRVELDDGSLVTGRIKVNGKAGNLGDAGGFARS